MGNMWIFGSPTVGKMVEKFLADTAIEAAKAIRIRLRANHLPERIYHTLNNTIAEETRIQLVQRKNETAESALNDSDAHVVGHPEHSL